MKSILLKLLMNYPYVLAIILFIIGATIVVKSSNLFKKLIGINIMESAVFLLFIAGSYIRGANEPIVDIGEVVDKAYVNPLPSALMLTGIVVSVSVTAFGLALILRLYRTYGTTNINKIEKMRDEIVEVDKSND